MGISVVGKDQDTVATSAFRKEAPHDRDGCARDRTRAAGVVRAEGSRRYRGFAEPFDAARYLRPRLGGLKFNPN